MQSFHYALEGIGLAIIKNRNFKIQITISILVIIAAYLFQISTTELLILLLTIALGLSIEMINSSIEEMTNLITTKWSIHAKSAKDVAAGAMLLYSCFAAIIGLIIFYPYIIRLLI